MNLMTSFFPKRVDHEAGGTRSRRFFFAALISISFFLSEKDRWNTPIPIDKCTGFSILCVNLLPLAFPKANDREEQLQKERVIE